MIFGTPEPIESWFWCAMTKMTRHRIFDVFQNRANFLVNFHDYLKK
eukprot:07690.XXX_394074_394211_1 [CDS] Oithona nana genome sequencing.